MADALACAFCPLVLFGFIGAPHREPAYVPLIAFGIFFSRFNVLSHLSHSPCASVLLKCGHPHEGEILSRSPRNAASVMEIFSRCSRAVQLPTVVSSFDDFLVDHSPQSSHL